MAESMERLRSLLGVWFTDSPTWPPAPGVTEAVRLAKDAEREYVESLSVYIGQIKDLTHANETLSRQLRGMSS